MSTKTVILENRDPSEKNKRETLIKKWYSNICAMESGPVCALTKAQSKPAIFARHFKYRPKPRRSFNAA